MLDPNGEGRKNGREVNFTVFSILIIFLVGVLVTGYFVFKGYEEKVSQKIDSNLILIYDNAQAVVRVEGKLANEADGEGVNESLSKLVKFDVYNTKKLNEYSVVRKNGKIKVYYSLGENERVYPPDVHKKKAINKEDVENQDLFTYEVSTGKAIVTGFSEDGYKFISSSGLIKIPEEYNGVKVVEIADSAFYNKKFTGQVIIPSTVVKVGRNSFSMNGVKQNSLSIPRPYTGIWKLDGKEWVNTK